jgi:hypothetical protein
LTGGVGFAWIKRRFSIFILSRRYIMVGQRSAGDDDVIIVVGASVILLVVGLIGGMLM